jgi:hypothetical protein
MSDLKFISEVEANLSTHEAICQQRYESIQDSFNRGSKRMQRIEYLLYAVIAVTFFGKDNLIELVKYLIVK